MRNEFKTLLQAINSNPSSSKEALETCYKGKVFAIGSGYNNHAERFFKTKRGAEGYIKRQQSTSYYDDYSQSMVTCGSGLFIEEINETDILPYDTSKQLWYNRLKQIQGHDYLYSQVLKQAEYYNVSEDIKEYIIQSIDDMKNYRGLLVIDELKQTETVQEVATTEQPTNDITVNAEQTEVNNTITDATYKLNEELNGIEIYFNVKPSEAIREQLKANKFRWSKRGFWYAKQNENTLQLAKGLCNNAITESEQTTDTTQEAYSYPEIDINDIETYVVSEQLSKRENNSSWVFRSKERNHTQEIQSYFTELNNDITALINTTDNEQIIYKLKKTLQYFKKHYFNNYVKRLENRANNPSWVVTGAAGRNRSRDQKMNNRYDKLMEESIYLEKDYKKRIRQLETAIRKDKEERIKKQVQNTNIDITFTTQTKEFTYMNIKEKKRVYIAGNYFICKLWNMFRIFTLDTMKEINTTLKTTSNLEEAKQFVSYLIQKEQQKAS